MVSFWGSMNSKLKIDTISTVDPEHDVAFKEAIFVAVRSALCAFLSPQANELA